MGIPRLTTPSFRRATRSLQRSSWLKSWDVLLIEEAVGFFAPVRINETLTLDFDEEGLNRSISITMHSK